MANPLSIIHSLPVLKFRGVAHRFYDVAGFDFSHSHGERSYPYVTGAAHDWTGLDARKFQFNLFFLNRLAPRHDPPLFPDLWNQWWRELQDGSPGKLVHPLLGEGLVVVNGGSVKLDASAESGITVSVNFTTTIRDPEEAQTFEPVKATVQQIAAKADAAAQDADIWKPKKTSESLLGLVKAIEGLVLQAQLEALGAINELQATVDGLIGLADKKVLDDPIHYQAHDALVELWVALADLHKKVGEALARPTGSVLLTNDMTLEAFAAAHDNTLGDIMDLNVAALASPNVPKGTMLKFYKAA